MKDNEQIPKLKDVIKDMPPKYIPLFILIGIILAALVFWIVAIL